MVRVVNAETEVQRRNQESVRFHRQFLAIFLSTYWDCRHKSQGDAAHLQKHNFAMDNRAQYLRDLICFTPSTPVFV